MDKKSKKTKWIYLISIIPLLAGCAPGPPLPPIFPGFEWLIIGFTIFLGIFVWKKYSSEEPVKTNYLTGAINDINHKLKELEKKIDELEKNR
ncbi:MAG: hypothetical protein DRH24_12625 [Deltaproteobacteria bacterium]|nr:MAG: hypothetical protein DRH24_12625 [Deltaproteobacteria bacterium]